MGLHRSTPYDWRREDPAFAAEWDGIFESLKDFAESKLHIAIGRGQAWAICFFLKCRAKDRGYVERSEVTGLNGAALAGPPMFQIIFESPKKES